MKIVVKNVRLSYVRVFEASAMPGSTDANYSVCLLIDKNSPEVEKIENAIKDAYSEFAVKYPKLKGNAPKMWNNPLRDGDAEKDGEEYVGMYFLNAKRKERQGAPIVIDRAKQFIINTEEVYSGCYGNVSISLYPYEFTGKYGVGVGLNAIQKVADGDRLDGGASVADFELLDDDDTDLLG